MVGHLRNVRVQLPVGAQGQRLYPAESSVLVRSPLLNVKGGWTSNPKPKDQSPLEIDNVMEIVCPMVVEINEEFAWLLMR